VKNPDRKTVSRLDALPNIGSAIAKDLELIGIEHPRQLVGQNPFELYDRLCKTTGTRIDHCVVDAMLDLIGI
jgi:hypothetical protein